MENTIYQIYDKIFKKILTLSSTAVINLINGLFDTDYPVDSTITYNWTEFESEELRKTLADTILTINGRYSYHMEAQMEEDETIILRVFDYGYSHAFRSAKTESGRMRIDFPEPKVIYLYSTRAVPDEYELELNFGKQGIFIYKVEVCKFQEIPTEEINRRKMVSLTPFMLLRVRELLKNERSPENLELLKKIIQDDIIGSVDKNLETGDITAWDARKIKSYTHKLYEHIYSHFEEMEALNEMTDESLMLDVDIWEKKFEMIEEKYTILEQQNSMLEQKNNTLEQQNSTLEQQNSTLTQQNSTLTQQNSTLTQQNDILLQQNERLKEALKEAGIQV